VAWLNGDPPRDLPPEVPARQIGSRYRVVGAVDTQLQHAADLAALRGERVLLLAGLARPQGFWRTARELGLHPVGCAAFGDHHAYTARELGALDQQALRLGATRIVTTE